MKSLQNFNINRRNAILMVVDIENEFCKPGGKMYSELVNIPLIIYDPGREKGEVCDTLVSTIDVSPTLVRLFGLNRVEAFEGQSLLPLDQYSVGGVYGEAVDKHGSQEKGEEKEVHYYREGDLKLIYHERGEVWELYDLKADPGELNNMISTSPEAERMKAKIRPRVRRYRP